MTEDPVTEVPPPDLMSPRFSGEPHLEAIYDGHELMAYGWYGCAVKKVQQALIDAGIALPNYGVDGDFRGETQTAVEQFQLAHGLTSDGIVGPKTLRVLEAAVPPYPSTPVDCGQPVIEPPPEVGVGMGTLSVAALMGEYAVADASVMAQKTDDPTNRIGRTDPSGRCVFGLLPAGYYTVSAQKPGFAPEQATILLDAGEWHEVVLRMARQGETGTPAVVGVSPLSERGVGHALFSTPHDLLLGNTRDEKEASARAEAEADATRNLGLAAEAEEQRVRSAYAGYTLRFRPESFTMECSQPDWTQESLDGQGAGTVVTQNVTVTCEASVHLHYESEEQQQE